MKQSRLTQFTLIAGFALALTPAVRAGIIGADDFSTNGPLIGSTPDVGGAWVNVSSPGINPLTVTGGAVPMSTVGEDDALPLSSTVLPGAGVSAYYGLDVAFTTAQITGDYFTALSTSGNAFDCRLYARSSDAGLQLGMTKANDASITWGTTVLSFGTTYRVVGVYDFIGGALNDVVTLYVNPTSSTQAGNTAYVGPVTATSTDAVDLTRLILRQGASGSASRQTVDNAIVATTFGEAAAVPEPASIGLLVLGAGTLLRRKRS